MSKKLILVLAVIVFFTNSHLVRADVIINEFSSASNPEWVELKNTGGSEVDLAGWKLTELTDPTGTPSEKNLKDLSGLTIPADGILTFDVGSTNLNNAGDSIGLYDGGTEIDRVTFGTVAGYSADLSAPSATKSGALIGGSWKNNQDPTKGTANPESGTSEETGGEENKDEDTPNEESNTDNSGSSFSSAPSVKKAPKPQIPKVQIIATSPVHAGVPFIFEATGTGKTGQKLSHGRYYWNFGDGDFREVKVELIEKFTHTYFYPGDYNVVLEYFPDIFTDVPDATAEITIKVIEPKVVISAVGGANDFFVEISNETGHNADISGWVLLSQYKIFTLPKNTILPSKRKMAISPKLSGFGIEDKNTLKLMTAQRELVFDYSASPSTHTVKSNSVSKSKTNNLKVSSLISEEENNGKEETVSEVGLSASALKSGVFDEKETEGMFSSWVIFPTGIIFVGGAAFAVHYIRKKRSVLESGDDFELLDE